MKKIFVLLSLVAFCYAGFAQDIVLSTGQTYKAYTGVAGDTLKATTKVISKVIWLSNPDFKDQWYKYDISVVLDSSGNGTDATVSLQGSYDNSHWTTIESENWGMTEDDTTIRFYNLASSQTITNAVAQHTETMSGTLVNAQHTETLSGTFSSAAYSIKQDTAGFRYREFPDSIKVPQITTTDGRINTIAAQTATDTRVNTVAAHNVTSTVVDNVVCWPYLRVYAVGLGSSARAELTAIRVKIIKPLKY